MRPASGSQVHGEAKFTQVGNRVRVTAEIAGLTPGAHGFHIHEKGDCSAADGMSTGGHFNPLAKKHGAPDTPDRHAGDLGNLTANDYGKATLALTVDGISVGKGPDGIIGKGDMRVQTLQALDYVKRTVEAGGARWDDIVHMTFYFTDREKWHREAIPARVEFFAKHSPGGELPCITSIGVASLMHPDMLIEIEATAVWE